MEIAETLFFENDILAYVAEEPAYQINDLGSLTYSHDISNDQLTTDVNALGQVLRTNRDDTGYPLGMLQFISIRSSVEFEYPCT
jgi:hypothetical protein